MSKSLDPDQACFSRIISQVCIDSMFACEYDLFINSKIHKKRKKPKTYGAFAESI